MAVRTGKWPTDARINFWAVLGILVLSAAAGVLLGFWSPTASTSSLDTDRDGALAVGDPLPDVVVFESPAKSHRLSDLLTDSADTILLVFSLGCSSCLGEAVKWDQLARSSAEVAFVGLACGGDWASFHVFRQLAALGFSVYRCDPLVRDELRIAPATTILRVINDTIVFRSHGDGATSELELLMRNG